MIDGKVALGGGTRWTAYDVQTTVYDESPALQVGEDLFDVPDGDLANAWRSRMTSTSGSRP